MSERRETRIEAYVEAVRTVRGIERAIDHEGHTPGRDEARLKAKRAELIAYKALTGGDLGKARRRLAELDAKEEEKR